MTQQKGIQHQHALVTGGNRGIGAAMATAIAAAGCDVTINYREGRDAAEQTAEAVRLASGRAAIVQADVSDPASVIALVRQAREALGPITILINNAGIGRETGVFENSLEDFDQTFAINVRAAFALTQAVIPEMSQRGFGRLIYLSSLAAITGGMISTAYASSKAALIGMMHHYAASLRDSGITANAIAPALIETDMVAAVNLPSPESLPMDRLGRPDEVGQVARPLIESGYITGQTIHINAGRYMT